MTDRRQQERRTRDQGVPKFPCPRCGDYLSKVTNVRPLSSGDGLGRRRQCLACGKRYNTREILTTPSDPTTEPVNYSQTYHIL